MISIYNDERQINSMSTAKIKEQKMSKHKDCPLFLFLKGQMHLYPYFHFHAIVLLKQYSK